eukprot:UN30733
MINIPISDMGPPTKNNKRKGSPNVLRLGLEEFKRIQTFDKRGSEIFHVDSIEAEEVYDVWSYIKSFQIDATENEYIPKELSGIYELEFEGSWRNKKNDYICAKPPFESGGFYHIGPEEAESEDDIM